MSASAVAVAVLTCTLAATYTMVGFLVKAYIGGRRADRDIQVKQTQQIALLTQQIEFMNQGATQGAQQLIRQVASRVELVEDAMEQFGDRMQAAEFRIQENRQALQDHKETPMGWAHRQQAG